MTDITHYNQRPRRRAEFIKPPNTLKEKVGSGGLTEEIINKAQLLLENNSADFQPIAEMYLDAIMKGIMNAQAADIYGDKENVIAAMLYPGMQLKANGGMFKYPLVTKVADKLIQFLEVIDVPELEAVGIVLAFHTSIKAIVAGKISGDGGAYGTDLVNALSDACYRYFEKHPENRNPSVASF